MRKPTLAGVYNATGKASGHALRRLSVHSKARPATPASRGSHELFDVLGCPSVVGRQSAPGGSQSPAGMVPDVVGSPPLFGASQRLDQRCPGTNALS
jgi:hypothetical protein